MSIGGYRYMLDEVAFECWRHLPPEDQEQLLDFFRWLREHPFYESAVSDFDATGRRLSLSPCGGYTVTHWTDHAVHEVNVTEIVRG